MDKKIKRIRINKLSSENGFFSDINFREGVNLILGEKYDEKSTRGRKTNGVGKSMCIEFLNFCLLCDYKKSRIEKIPKEILKPDGYITLDLNIGDDKIQIKRNVKEQDKPIIIRNEKETQFNKLEDAKNYLTELMFSDLPTGKQSPSYRNLLSILIRDEKSEFSSIIKCHDINSKVPDDLTPHLFLLGMSLEKYRKVKNIITEIDDNYKVGKKIKDELTEHGVKKIPDVKAEMNALESEIQQIELALESYKSNKAFETIEEDLSELENMLEQLRCKQKILKRNLGKIKDLPKPEQVDDDEIRILFNQFRDNLGDAIVKSLEEVIGFKNRVENFQRIIVNEKARDLEKQITEISSQIREFDDMYSEKLRVLDTKGILRNLKTSLRVYELKKEESLHTKLLFSQYEKIEKQKKNLSLAKTTGILKIDEDIEKLEKEYNSFMSTISDIHEAIMGNKECSFEIKTKDLKRGKTPVEISMRVFDDGSHSVDRTKVFIYDMALLFNEYTRNRHPLFLVHDNIFDVDQDTLVQCLNYLAKQEELYSDFQYILTLNRDKIENEERRKLIKLDIDDHQVAVFTKKNKFMHCDYQER